MSWTSHRGVGARRGRGHRGPARRAADRYGCHVTGIDLSPDFVDLARNLTDRVGLTDLVTFDAGSATAMPYDGPRRSPGR